MTGLATLTSIFIPVYEAYKSTLHLWPKRKNTNRRPSMSTIRSRRGTTTRHDDLQHRLESLVQWAGLGFSSRKLQLDTKKHDEQVGSGEEDAAEGPSTDLSRSADADAEIHPGILRHCRHVIYSETLDSYEGGQETQIEVVLTETQTQTQTPAPVASLDSMRHELYLHVIYMWLTNRRDIKITLHDACAWEALRFIARGKLVVLGGACCTLFSMCIGMAYVAGGYAQGCIAPGVHAIILALSFCWLRFANVHQKGT